jgi:hypothetical protein
MSGRKRQRRLEEHYRTRLAPWMAGILGACVPRFGHWSISKSSSRQLLRS